MRTFGARVKGAMLLDASLYEEVEADRSALGQAMTVVILSSLASGVGMGVSGGFAVLIRATVITLVGWLLWAWLIYFIGTHLLPTAATSSSWGELLRTLGFAAAPGLFRILSFLPVLGYAIAYAVGVWMLVAMVIAVRQALDYDSTWRAVGVCLTGWIVFVVFGTLFTLPLS